MDYIGSLKRFKYGSAIVLLLSLAGCGDVTGDGPEIVNSKDDRKALQPSMPSATPTATPFSGWNEVARNAFAGTSSPVVAIRDPQASATAVSSTVAPSSATAPSASLADSSSLYIRQGQKSSVFWKTWTAEAFNEASQRKAPLFIVIGATWNHPAQMMDNQVFSDPEVSAAINKNYVPVRVDADEHPEIWARYRLAYEVINKQRATAPLIIFALPDGRPFDVISSVPARTEADNTGLLDLLGQASMLYATRTDTVSKQAESIEGVVTKLLSDGGLREAALSSESIVHLMSALVSAAKGDRAEFLRAGRVADVLLTFTANGFGSDAKEAASELLLSRFRSGQRDHVLGGYFFRTPDTSVIQFGKLLPVQTEMIAANAHAYAMTGKSLHKEAVTEVIRFCQDWLEAPDGGFFSGQSPDLESSDGSAYFTWTREEIAQIVDDQKSATVFSEYLNAKAGEKTNLHVTGRLQQAADIAGASYAEANDALNAVRMKLRDARMAAENAPPVDKSILSGWNGDMICAYLDAAEFLGDEKSKSFALKTADMIIESMVSEQEGVAHVMYKGRASGFGYLEDNVKVAAGLLRCHEATGQNEYLESAKSLMEYVEARFLDKKTGLYEDIVNPSDTHGLLKIKRLPLEDDISCSANAIAAITWANLGRLENNDNYKQRAERMIKAAIGRTTFDNETVSTWGKAAAIVLKGKPALK